MNKKAIVVVTTNKNTVSFSIDEIIVTPPATTNLEQIIYQIFIGMVEQGVIVEDLRWSIISENIIEKDVVMDFKKQEFVAKAPFVDDKFIAKAWRIADGGT